MATATESVEPSRNSRILLRAKPQIALTIWLIGFWLFIAIVLCIADNRMNAKPSDTLAIKLMMICYFACHAQHLAILTLAFFSPWRPKLVSILLGVICVLATAIIFRVFNPLLFKDVWPLYSAYPLTFLIVCSTISLGSLLLLPRREMSNPFQICIFDFFLVMLVVAVFLALLQNPIHDPLSAALNDPRQYSALHPEFTSRTTIAAIFAIDALAYVALTRKKRSLLVVLLILVGFILFDAFAHVMSWSAVNLAFRNGDEPWTLGLFLHRGQNCLQNTTCFFLWFAASIALFRACGLFPLVRSTTIDAKGNV